MTDDIDPRHRRLGRQGLAQARAALEAATQHGDTAQKPATTHTDALSVSDGDGQDNDRNVVNIARYRARTERHHQ